MHRRELLKIGCSGIAAVATPTAVSALNAPVSAAVDQTGLGGMGWLNVRQFGATGDGKTLDTDAINRAIDAAAAAGGGTVVFPPGDYLSFSIRLKSFVSLHLQRGSTIVAADSPLPGQQTGYNGGGYDLAQGDTSWSSYQDYDHNHWRNSLIWGEGIHDFSITGSGRIYGKGLGYTDIGAVGRDGASRGNYPVYASDQPGVGIRAIALKNCHNVLLRDFSILKGGWDAILTTGVDNLSIDNLTFDTERGAIDIDCCRNVRVSNCTVNSPWDDGICLKSSFALGYARPTENVTISNCYVTGDFQLGSVLDGTWNRHPRPKKGLDWQPFGRIKLGTESNGGFLNITISNCVFEGCQGFALETEDGAICEDITFTGITMRNITNAAIFVRLGTRLRGPRATKPGKIRRVILSDIVSSSTHTLPSILSGVPGHPIEDIKISNVYLEQTGGGTAAMAALQPEEREAEYPDPDMFGDLPACGFFVRHVRNLEMTNIEIATHTADVRPAFWLRDVVGADFFRVRVPQGKTPVFDLRLVKDFRCFGSRQMADVTLESVEERKV